MKILYIIYFVIVIISGCSSQGAWDMVNTDYRNSIHGDNGGEITEPELNISMQAYIKASNAETADQLGNSIAVDGNTMVVGACMEDSGTGAQGDNSKNNSGAVYVFIREGNTWSQQAYLKASYPTEGDCFGASVAISGDTLVVGANLEDSNATGVNGDESNDDLEDSGAAFVFVRNGSTWTKQAYLKADPSSMDDLFGNSVDIYGDRIIVGVHNDDSKADNAGAAYIFVRNGTVWTQEAYLTASNAKTSADFFGIDVAMDGDTVAVSASGEDGSVAGVIPGAPSYTDIIDGIGNSGAVYIFIRDGSTWTQQAYIKASNPGAMDLFGTSIDLSGDTLVVGAPYEDSNSTGINNDQGDDPVSLGNFDSGAVYVFTRTGSLWQQQSYIKASNTGEDDLFGTSVAVYGDIIISGSPYEDSSLTGLFYNFPDNIYTGDSLSDAGAVYAFMRWNSAWSQKAYIKAPNRTLFDYFGDAVDIWNNTIVVGVKNEDCTLFDQILYPPLGENLGGADNNLSSNSGAAYIFY